MYSLFDLSISSLNLISGTAYKSMAFAFSFSSDQNSSQNIFEMSLIIHNKNQAENEKLFYLPEIQATIVTKQFSQFNGLGLQQMFSLIQARRALFAIIATDFFPFEFGIACLIILSQRFNFKDSIALPRHLIVILPKPRIANRNVLCTDIKGIGNFYQLASLAKSQAHEIFPDFRFCFLMIDFNC